MSGKNLLRDVPTREALDSSTDESHGRYSDAFIDRPISSFLELGAYESLWLAKSASFASIADLFRNDTKRTPSSFVDFSIAAKTAAEALSRLSNEQRRNFGVRVHGAGEYPLRLRDARHPVELLYYRGWWDLAHYPKSLAVVGTRQLSNEGVKRTQRLVRQLVQENYTIVSGLARGVDTVAHTTAIENDGWTIAVIGTPVHLSYPRENAALQEFISKNFLLISQVPILRYEQQDYRQNRFFFPERNKTMSALTQGTVIVEAGETSGTLIQAQAALDQGRSLFILDNCFRNPKLKWPHIFAERGAVRVRDFDTILAELPKDE